MVNFNNDEVVKEIKRRLSILDLVESYTSIKKVGKGYVGLCPFHDDHNPSMHVNEEKGFFHCFSCGAGGDILAFYMRYNSATFPEAVSELAKRANIKVEKQKAGPGPKSQARTLLKINSIVSGFYKRILLKSPKAKAARQYLNSRNIPPDTVDEFNLGYAPDGWDYLIKYLEKRKIPLTLAEKTGLIVKKNNSEGYYDRFRNRVMFPICDIEGKVIGFGGRIVEGEGDQPKYINSPESEIYHKRRNFYGLDKSRDQIRKNNIAIIVEGYTDLLSLYSAGIKNVVATLGTSLTRDHVVILRRYTDRFVVVFDGDESGTKAAVRSLDIFLEEGLLPNVVLLPEGKDPDSFISRYGKDEFLKLIHSSPSLIDFYVESIIRECRNGNLSLKGGVREIAAILTKLNDPLLRSSYVKKTAERLGLRENEVSSLIKHKKGPGGIGNAKILSVADNHEKLLLVLLLKFPQLSSTVARYNWDDLISNVDIKYILNEIVVNGVHDPSSLLQNFQGNPAQSLISEALFSFSGISDEKTAGKMIDSCIGKLRLRKLEEDLKSLRLQIDEASKNKNSLLEKELLKKYSDLMKQKNRKKGEPNGKE